MPRGVKLLPSGWGGWGKYWLWGRQAACFRKVSVYVRLGSAVAQLPPPLISWMNGRALKLPRGKGGPAGGEYRAGGPGGRGTGAGGRAGRARRAEQASGGSSSFVARRAKSFPPHSSNKRWADRGQGFPGGNTVGVSTMESRAVTSEVAYAPELASKPVSWNQPGSSDGLSRTATPSGRRPHHGNTVGA